MRMLTDNGIESLLKKWNPLLIPDGDYFRLRIKGVYDCKGLAKHLMNTRRDPHSSIVIFGEKYAHQHGEERNLENCRRVSFNDRSNYRGFTILRRKLRPIPFRGERIWGMHCVYTSDNTVFDPVLGEPYPLTGFDLRLFGEEVPFEEYIVDNIV